MSRLRLSWLPGVSDPCRPVLVYAQIEASIAVGDITWGQKSILAQKKTRGPTPIFVPYYRFLNPHYLSTPRLSRTLETDAGNAYSPSSTKGLGADHQDVGRSSGESAASTQRRNRPACPTSDSGNRPQAHPVVVTSRRPAHKVHIIGTDERAKFIAHALQGSYHEVEFISPPSHINFTNIVFDSHESEKRKSRPLPSRILGSSNRPLGWCHQPSSSTDRIIDLVITENSIDTLKQVRDRIDHRSTICVAPDGLGLVERARKEVFHGRQHQPAFVLGHLSRAYQLSQSTMAVRQMPRNLTNGFTYLTQSRSDDLLRDGSAELPLPNASDDRKSSRRLMRRFESSHNLQARTVPFDNWLRLKLPAMVFSSVVDPICTILGCRYDQVLHNPRGVRMIDQLLDEISELLRKLPEAEISPEIVQALESEQIRRYCLGQIRGKGRSPSPMAVRVQSGKWTDIDYLNGYFVRRGEKIGMELSANRLIMSMVKAKQAQQLKKIDLYVPWDEASRD